MFFKKKNQVIKFEQNLCNANVYDNNVLFVRVNDIVTCKEALVEVPYTHNAFLIKGGGDVRFLKSGTYPVFDNAKEVANWKRNVSVEVVYMPVETNFQVNWGTPRKLEYKDVVLKKVITVGAAGTFEICIKNYEQFFRKAIGFEKEFDKVKFSKRMQNYVVDEFINKFIVVVKEMQITYDEFDENRQKIARRIEAMLSEKMESEYGIILKDFIITHFDLSQQFKEMIDEVEEDKKRKAERLEMEEKMEKEKREREEKLEKEKREKDAKLKEYLAILERLEDKQWEREKYLHQLEQEDRNAYYEVLKELAKNGGNAKPVLPEEKKIGGGYYCPNCGHRYEPGADFCTNCGKSLGNQKRVCPSCKSENLSNATFCCKCGKRLK